MNKLFKRAFTLIELLVVIAIIGILSGLIVVGMDGVTQKATIAKAQVFSNSLRNALMLNLISEWKFDGSGVVDGAAATTAYAQDSWGTGTGSIVGAPLVYSGASCIYGSCLYFDGVDDSLSVADSNVLDVSSITVEAWVKFTALPTIASAHLVSKDDAYWFAVDTAGSLDRKIKSYDANGTAASAVTGFATGRWYHLVGSFDNSTKTIKYYVDGALVSGGGTIINNAQSSTNTLYIGKSATLANSLVHGYLDTIRLYNGPIPISQIEEDYYAGLNNLLIKGSISGEEYAGLLSSK
jgi:prepilin-type N-terminal cleavage/methylation domain-containing protein